MENKDLKKIEFEIQNLLALRTGYNAIVIVLTGGLISILFNDINMFKGILFIIGLLLDYLYLFKSLSATKQINLLIKRVN